MAWRRCGIGVVWLLFGVIAASSGGSGASVGWATGCAEPECVPDPLPACTRDYGPRYACDSCGEPWFCGGSEWLVTDVACHCFDDEGRRDTDICPADI